MRRWGYLPPLPPPPPIRGLTTAGHTPLWDRRERRKLQQPILELTPGTVRPRPVRPLGGSFRSLPATHPSRDTPWASFIGRFARFSSLECCWQRLLEVVPVAPRGPSLFGEESDGVLGSRARRTKRAVTSPAEHWRCLLDPRSLRQDVAVRRQHYGVMARESWVRRRRGGAR